MTRVVSLLVALALARPASASADCRMTAAKAAVCCCAPATGVAVGTHCARRRATTSLRDGSCCELRSADERQPATTRAADPLPAPERESGALLVAETGFGASDVLAAPRAVEAARRAASSPPLRVLLCTFLC